MEIWKDITGYTGLYQVSNLGRVKSLARTRKDKYGNMTIKMNDRILSADKSGKGYPRIVLCNKGVTEKCFIHRLVAQEFIPNPTNLPQVNHKDGCKTNNNVRNLEWVSPSENIKHAFDTNLKKPTKGEAHGQSKLTWDDVNCIRSEYSSTLINQTKLAEKYNISRVTCQEILANEIWYDKTYVPVKDDALTSSLRILQHKDIAQTVIILSKSGIQAPKIAKALKVSTKVIYNIISSPLYQEWYKRTV